ncbi:hypothetical protein ZIOFF_043049 [Zingiber officinale]|uniref:Uncharacterized protein n=1 Tax=Zingiber officinale TaxID=94328 RepID=A0A8J5FUK3_ZINOF|nr:hypothetical protein ZIOFF_043049 [Zingiber officinale]
MSGQDQCPISSPPPSITKCLDPELMRCRLPVPDLHDHCDVAAATNRLCNQLMLAQRPYSPLHIISSPTSSWQCSATRTIDFGVISNLNKVSQYYANWTLTNIAIWEKKGPYDVEYPSWHICTLVVPSS